MAKKCIFCGKGGPFTREHVLPEWTAKLIGLGRVQVTREMQDRNSITWAQVGTFGHTVTSVCKKCNGGWMSELETDVRPFLSKMIYPRTRGSVRLDPDEQMLLAGWLWKTAILQEDVTHTLYVTRSERQALWRGNAPPQEGVMMWISIYTGSLIANLKGGPALFGTPDGRTLNGLLLSMSIGLFAAQILCRRKLPNTRTKPRAQFSFAHAESMIWPESPDIVDWPPGRPLSGDDFGRWHRRWNTRG